MRPSRGGPQTPGAPTGQSTLRGLRHRRDTIARSFSTGAIRRGFLNFQRKIGITRAGQMAILGAFLLWVMARVVAGTAIYMASYSVVLALLASSLVAPRRLRLHGTRTGLFPRVQEGDALDVEVSLQAQRRVGTFILEERVPDLLGTPVKVPVTRLPAGTVVTHRYGLRCARRGAYQVGPLVAVARDPLGFTQRERVVAEPFELLVHPRVERVFDRPLTRQYEDPPIRPPVSKPWPSGLEFYGMRDYRPGDDLRRIVWRASARTGKLMVREAEQGITDKIQIILDTDFSRHSRDEDVLSESFETAVRVAASLGVKHLRDGYEVNVMTNAGPLTRPMRGGAMQMILLDGLAKLELQREPLTQGITRLLARPQRDAHHILITGHLGPHEAAQLKLLVNKGVSVLVVALLWTQEAQEAEVLRAAAGLGCMVTGIRPDQDIAEALFHEIGAGSR